MQPTSTQLERDRISAAISAHLARQHASRILDEHRSERDSIRAARREQAEAIGRASVAQLAAGQRPNLESLAIRHQQRAIDALSYPMQPAEVLAAVMDAARAARLPEHDESTADAISATVLQVIARHGRQPIRAKVGRHWLLLRVKREYLRESIRRERATGLRASAAIHAGWQREQDSGSAGDTGPDAVYWQAAGLPAPTPSDPADSASVAQLAARRLRLTDKQTAAIERSLEAAKRVTLKLSAAERTAASEARRVIRSRYPDQAALRLALLPDVKRERATLEAAVDSAISRQRERATIAALGSGLTGERDSASCALLARFSRQAGSGPVPPRAGMRQLSRWPGGDGYAGASSCLYLYGERRESGPLETHYSAGKRGQRVRLAQLSAEQQAEREQLRAILRDTVRLPAIGVDRSSETQGPDPWDTRSAAGHDPLDAEARQPLVSLS